jgi:chromosome segregation ATPase
MPTLEERVAFLEGRLADHTGAVDSLRGATTEARGLFQALDGKIDTKIDGLDRKIDTKIAELDTKIDGLHAKIDSLRADLNAKMDRHFTWLVGILLAGLVSALIGR